MLVLKVWRRSRRSWEVWQWERAEQFTRMVTLRIRWSTRVEMGHADKLRFSTMERAYLQEVLDGSAAGDTNILKITARLDYCQGQLRWWSGASLNKGDRLHVLCQALRRIPEDHGQIPVIEHSLIYTDRVDFALFRFVTLSWLFPSGIRKYLFWFYRHS